MYKFLRFMYETAVSYAATLALLMAVSPAHAATFNLFSPATGILKGMTSTYVTTSASYSDIVALFSGTCNSTTALRGDGSCGTLSTGTVTSVALTAPSVFSVSGSPVTSSGTLAISFATGQTQNQVLASPNGSSGAITLRSLVNADLANSAITINGTSTSLGGTRTLALASSDFANNGTTTTVLHGNAAGNPSFAAVSLTADVSGTLAAGSGGTGVATLTGIAKGNGTSAFTAAASSDVYGLWSGTCSSSTYLRGDGSCQTPPTGGTAANPTATIGLTAVNGSAGTYLRSDGAPALSQAIAPTWTGQHTFDGNTVVISTSAISQNPLRFDTNGQAANAKTWGMRVGGGGDFQIGIGTDNTSGIIKGGLNLIRTGAAITSINLGNTTDNPAYAFLGTGTTTFGGAVSGVGGTWTGVHTFSGIGNRVVLSGGDTSAIYSSASNTGGAGYWGIDASTGGGLFTGSPAYSMGLGTSGATSLVLGTNSAERVRIASAGNVTINAPSSGTGLTVSGAGASDPGLNIAAGTLAIAGAEGSAGQVLTSNGGSAAPSWNTIPKMVGADCSSTSSGSCTQNFTYGGATITFSSRSTGTVNITLGGFTATPTCNATSRRGASVTTVMEIPTVNSTAVVVVSRDTNSYAANDQEFEVICIGN